MPVLGLMIHLRFIHLAGGVLPGAIAATIGLAIDEPWPWILGVRVLCAACVFVSMAIVWLYYREEWEADAAHPIRY
jgi:hypothetical protein